MFFLTHIPQALALLQKIISVANNHQ